jgi:hypothetical protein
VENFESCSIVLATLHNDILPSRLLNTNGDRQVLNTSTRHRRSGSLSRIGNITRTSSESPIRNDCSYCSMGLLWSFLKVDREYFFRSTPSKGVVEEFRVSIKSSGHAIYADTQRP